jgi:hypothetical protein
MAVPAQHEKPNLTNPSTKEIHMDQAVAATAVPTTIGAPFGGGFYMGRVFVGLAAYALIVAPRAEGEFEEIEWNKSFDKVDGALSYFDGLENTKAMAAAGSPLAQKALDLRIDGHDDWFIPSRQDLLVIKGNEADAGETFAEDGAEAFDRDDWYWSSTQFAAYSDYAWMQDFINGFQSYYHKDDTYRARAVRRVAI